jgi:hypothetical protein
VQVARLAFQFLLNTSRDVLRREVRDRIWRLAASADRLQVGQDLSSQAVPPKGAGHHQGLAGRTRRETIRGRAVLQQPGGERPPVSAAVPAHRPGRQQDVAAESLLGYPAADVFELMVLVARQQLSELEPYVVLSLHRC